MPKRPLAGIIAAAAAAPAVRALSAERANRCSRGQVEVPLSGFEAVPPGPDTEFVASSWLLEVSLLCWLPRRLPTPGPQLLAGRRTACAGHVLVPGAWGEPGAEGDSKGGSEGTITVQPGRGLGTAVRVPTRAESQRAGPLHAGQAVCCLPGAVRSERRHTRGRWRGGPSSHTPGPGCH